MATRQTPRGFTLIELLIVVAIISILASIAVPNFLDAQTRAKVARVRNDLRLLNVSLEAYHVDNQAYPSRTKAPLSPLLPGTGDVEFRTEELKCLTTPIAYMTALPVDVFAPRRLAEEGTLEDAILLDYWTPYLTSHMVVCIKDGPLLAPRSTWALASQGPDQTFGMAGFWGNMLPPNSPYFATHIQDYDPTNGTISAGNIYRFKFEENALRVFAIDKSLCQ